MLDTKTIFEVAKIELLINKVKAVHNIERHVELAKNSIIHTECENKRSATTESFEDVLNKILQKGGHSYEQEIS